MKRLLALAFAALSGCATLPPKHDPEGCDRVAEGVKRAGSDLVVDGDLHCASDKGDCELTPARIVAHKAVRPMSKAPIPVHILRKEAEQFGDELSARGEIAFCFPARLWFPSEGTYRGRFYLLRETDGRYRIEFYPRARAL